MAIVRTSDRFSVRAALSVLVQVSGRHTVSEEELKEDIMELIETVGLVSPF
jgi:hypothetical protein